MSVVEIEDIRLAAGSEEIERCYGVMRQLRPHIGADEFVARVEAQQARGYQLAYGEAGAGVAVVAGFRLGENLAWGRFLYVDDLVTDEAARSNGYGKAMLDWLRRYALDMGCEQLHLDSGLQRKQAHRFYEREGMQMASYHYMERL